MDHGHISDAELVRRALGGEEAAYGQLVRRYLRPALAAAWEYVDTREDAEDLVQDAFFRALRRLDRFDTGRPFAPWFFTIVRNLGRNSIAHRARWRFVRLPDALAGRTRRADAAERREVRDRVAEAMDCLPHKQRACFRLCELEGFSRSEVARMLDLSDSTVRVHLHRARAALRSSLGDLVETSPDQDGDMETRMAT
ncbi:MAG: sigma-70 family RNA polymerase sigma factor [Gemmatimonadota bacterium]|nr:sigma-70 family RNA polymerase sigma factor [Gemmatimonadota bacterium]